MKSFHLPTYLWKSFDTIVTDSYRDNVYFNSEYLVYSMSAAAKLIASEEEEKKPEL